MKIGLTCPCGASASFEDTPAVGINDDFTPDPKGQVFLIEARATEWQESHAACLVAHVARTTPRERKEKAEGESGETGLDISPGSR